MDLPDAFNWQGLPGRIDQASSKPLGVVKASGEIVRDQQRVTDVVDTRLMQQDIRTLLARFLIDQVQPFFGQQVEWFEEPQVLRYRQGGYYRPHSDRDHWDRSQNAWVQSIDRDLSVLIYLNDGFEGGELHFPHIGLRLRPRPGLAVAFPSDHRFLHTATPVTAGVRHAIVSWCAVRGGQRVGRKGTTHVHSLAKFARALPAGDQRAG